MPGDGINTHGMEEKSFMGQSPTFYGSLANGGTTRGKTTHGISGFGMITFESIACRGILERVWSQTVL